LLVGVSREISQLIRQYSSKLPSGMCWDVRGGFFFDK
jgi:hypothetical protein